MNLKIFQTTKYLIYLLLVNLVFLQTISSQIPTPSPSPNKATTTASDEKPTPTITFVRKTADGGFLVKMNGVLYKLVSAEELRAIQSERIELQGAREIIKIQSSNLSAVQSRLATDVENLNKSYEQQLNEKQALYQNCQNQLTNELIKAGKRKEVVRNEKINRTLRIVDNPLTRFLAKVFGWIL